MADSPAKDEKTEDATPRKREEARDRGQVAMSQELIAAVMLCAAFATLAGAGPRLAEAVGALTVSTVGQLPTFGTSDWSVPALAGYLQSSSVKIIRVGLLVPLPLLATGLLVGYGQVGFKLTPQAVAMKLEKVNPIKGVGRLFSARSAMRTGMAFLKIVLITTTVVAITWYQIPNVIRLGNNELGPVLTGLAAIFVKCVAGALGAILVLALIDLAFQRFQFDRDLKMTKQEIREEHKTTEGDPHLRARIRATQRELGQRRMLDDVPKASVIITNPTHYSVALMYDRETSDAAPRLVAKGVDHLALKIRQVATASGIQIYEDPPLARALYAQVEVGAEIPEEFFAAVATVLSYVYGLESRARATVA